MSPVCHNLYRFLSNDLSHVKCFGGLDRQAYAQSRNVWSFPRSFSLPPSLWCVKARDVENEHPNASENSSLIFEPRIPRRPPRPTCASLSECSISAPALNCRLGESTSTRESVSRCAIVPNASTICARIVVFFCVGISDRFCLTTGGHRERPRTEARQR